MKNKSLAFQIWAVISGMLLVISLLLVILFPTTLRNFFTNEIYTTIENEQHILTEYGLPGRSGEYYFESKSEPSLSNRTVNHILLPEHSSRVFVSKVLPREFLQEAQSLAAAQDTAVEHYSRNIDSRTLFYVIRKVSVNGQPAFLLSFSWDTYRNDLVFTLFKQLLVTMSIVFLLSWIPSIWLAKYLSRPLVSLEKHVKRISEQDWHEPVAVDRRDEIGKLGQSIEHMRERLVRKEESQQTLLQNISHDLKTPVMVIRSYAQSIQDGIYPKGDLSRTVQVIEDESENLEKKIRNLLYLTKLDYLSTRQPVKETVDFSSLIQQVVDKFRWTRKDLRWHIKTDHVQFIGDSEQWSKVVENLIENQLRYARSYIAVSLTREEKFGPYALLKISNDGPPIEPSLIENLFQPFHKGSKGEFGIGLSIVKRIVSFHDAEINAVNEDEGVSFYIRIPL